jgi:hypothetical protein
MPPMPAIMPSQSSAEALTPLSLPPTGKTTAVKCSMNNPLLSLGVIQNAGHYSCLYDLYTISLYYQLAI